jgi:hypothetical protein
LLTYISNFGKSLCAKINRYFVSRIDSSFESPLRPVNSKIEARKEKETQQKSSCQFGEEFAREIVTEKNVTEVSFNILGLDFRKITSAEKQYTKMVSKSASQTRDESRASENATLETEVIHGEDETEQNGNEGKIHRAYLLKEPAHRTLHYLA